MTCFTTDAIPADIEMDDTESHKVTIVQFKKRPTVLILPVDHNDDGLFVDLSRPDAICLGVKLIYNAIFVR